MAGRTVKNERDGVTLTFTGIRGEKATIRNDQAGDFISFDPPDDWFYNTLRAIAWGRQDYGNGNGWGAANTYTILTRIRNDNRYSYLGYDAEMNHLSSGTLKKLNPNYRGVETFFDFDLNQNGVIDDKGYFAVYGSYVKEDAKQASLRITRKSRDATTVRLETFDISATAGIDYVPLQVDVSFADGESQKLLNIDITNDLAHEETERIGLRITVDETYPYPVIYAGREGFIDIADDDAASDVITVNGNNNGTINTGTINNNTNDSSSNNITFLVNNIINNYYNSNNTTTNINTWNTYKVNNSVKARDIVFQWFGNDTSIQQALSLSETKLLDIQASSWNDKVLIKSVGQAGDNGGRLEAPQIDDLKSGNQGSVLNGAGGKDQIQAKAGWDVLDGGANDDFIRAGNGRDIITGGLGADQLWGDFGWNTYKSEKDGFRDLIAIKSDQNLVNWLYGKAGNNANGQKADIIEGLDANDVIKILGASTGSLSFANTSAHGLSGIGIFVGDVLEALYTGGDLSIDQIRTMTSGDASTAAMNNTLSGYGSW